MRIIRKKLIRKAKWKFLHVEESGCEHCPLKGLSNYIRHGNYLVRNIMN
jgi:hypothetical protein